MSLYDPWETQHAQVRLSSNERAWAEFVADEFGLSRVPTEIVVCPQCGGRGRSSLYLGVFTADEMNEDPDFAAEYAAGGYDRTCESCGGRNVVEQVDVAALSPELARSYVGWMRDAAHDDAVARQEMRFGA